LKIEMFNIQCSMFNNFSYLWLLPKVLPLGKNQIYLFFLSLIRTFAPEKTNVDRFGLLATTVKNAKTRNRKVFLTHFCPISLPIHY